jgi:FAD-linked oxidoreductase
MKRRQFIQGSLALGATATFGGIAGCGATGTEPQTPIPFKAGRPIPWVNWAGNQSCLPKWRHAPASQDELLDVLKSAKGNVRAVGAGHSFSAVVPTNDTLISTDLLSGLVSHDAKKQQATLQAGTRLNACGPILDAIGQAFPNMPDMDYPSLGGALANSVHATGVDYKSMSGYIENLKLATVNGDLIECSHTKNPEIFQAAKTHIGSLGVVTEYTLQNQARFDITEVNSIEPLEYVFENMAALCKQNRHFECFLIPYASECITVSTNLAKPEDVNVGHDDPQAVNTLRSVFEATSWIPKVGTNLYSYALSKALAVEAATIRTGPSYKVFPHERIVRFREMEYTVPAEVGVACGREIMETIKNKKLPLSFPIEFRYVKGDDIWLSMFEGQDGCSISIHQYGNVDYKKIFAEIEPIFWKYGGRPHWGKIHTMKAPALAKLYGRHWQDFHEVRMSLDSTGKFMNAHLKDIFGA